MRQTGRARAWPRARVRRGGIFAGSALFHVVVFFVVFSRAAGALVSAGDAGGGPTGPVFAVTLVRLAAPVQAETAEAAAQAASPLRMKLRNVSADNAISVQAAPQKSAFAALTERLSAQSRPVAAPDSRFPATRIQPPGAYIPDPTRLSDARSRRARTDQGTNGETSTSASTGALWGAIEPCWRNLGFRGQAPVTIDVTLDGQGRLRGPPKVVRSTSALLNEPRLKSEANALAALAACMPKGDVRVAGNSFRLEFPATP